MALQLLGYQPLAVTSSPKTNPQAAACSTARTARSEPWFVQVGPGIQQIAQKYRLTIPEESDVTDFEYLGSASTRFQNRALLANINDHTTTTNIIVSYENHLRQFWRFAALKGDFKSMLMLLKKPPVSPGCCCPSMSVHTLEEYLRFQRLDPGTPLLDHHGTAPVLDMFGTPITCAGGWRMAPENMKIFCAAISEIHMANNQSSDVYEEECEDCLGGLPDGGCQQQHHEHNPAPYRRGNPTCHPLFRNTMTNLDPVATVVKEYEETATSQLLPSDLRLLRSRWLGTNSITDFRDWTIAILASKAALRQDEFHKIQAHHFLPAFFEITDTTTSSSIDALAFQVYSQSLHRWCPLKIHADHEAPDLCPVRSLLVYLHLIHWNGGYVFPTREELMNPPSDYVYKTHIDSPSFLKNFRNVCKETLPPRTPELKIGGHVFLRTYYLLGVFGQAGELELRSSARHNNLPNSRSSHNTATMDYNTHLNNPVPTNNVSKWKPILIDPTSRRRNSMMLASNGGFKVMPITEVPNFFVHTVLCVPKNSPTTIFQAHLIEKARTYVPIDSPSQKMAALMTRLSVEDSTLLDEILNGFVAERVHQLLAKSNPELLDRAIAALIRDHVASSPPIVTPVHPVTFRKRKCEIASPGKNDLPGHATVKDLEHSRLKLHAMMGLAQAKSESVLPLTGRAKTWASRYLKPAMDCLKNHFANDPELFLAAHPAYHPTTFPTKYCNGKGTRCSHHATT